MKQVTFQRLWPKAAEIGLLGMGYPEECDGIPADSWHSWIVNEELARIGVGGISASLMVHGIGLPPVINWGSEAMKAEIAPPLFCGGLVCWHYRTWWWL